MVGDMGHKGGLINPRPWRGQYQAGFSNTGGSPKPRKRAPYQKKTLLNFVKKKLAVHFVQLNDCGAYFKHPEHMLLAVNHSPKLGHHFPVSQARNHHLYFNILLYHTHE